MAPRWLGASAPKHPVSAASGSSDELLHSFREQSQIFADGGYTGKLTDWTAAMFAWTIEIVKRSDAGKFVVLPKRWIVERTFAWLALSRRLNRDHEINPLQSEAMIQLAMIHLLIKRHS